MAKMPTNGCGYDVKIANYYNMRVYIVCSSDGNYVERFETSCNLLSEIGCKVLNPEPITASVMEKHLGMVLSCDVVYILDGWDIGRETRTVYRVAYELGKDIWFESNMGYEDPRVLRVRDAIHEVTGLRLAEYITKSRKCEMFFARMLFSHHCRQSNMKVSKIAEYLHRDHSSISYILHRYQDEVRYNPEFRNIAERVDKILNK